ncbi:hypothetical protein [Microvirga sesbaniae]|uniref:hypothetical protein n=1 Tax=Microvirga sesbaniae TaxID=681392 RepID=UPI0021C57C7D|nr:hypothetical protein [Microvirga sp. HBU67692]
MLRSRLRSRSRSPVAGRRGAVGSLLDLDYVRNLYHGRSLADHVAGRASQAYTPDHDGVYHLTQATEPRRTSAGFLLEHGATNAVPNAWLHGAAAGTPGALPTGWAVTVPTGTTLSVEAVTTHKGLPVIDLRLRGAATGGGFQIRFGGLSDIPAAAGQNWAFSAFLHLLETSGNLLDLRLALQALNGSAIGLGANDSGNVLPQAAAWSRPATNLVGTPAGTAKIVGLLTADQDFSGSVALDERIRIAVPQIEPWNPLWCDAPFPTTPIRTEGAAAARDFEHAHVSLDGLGVTNAFTGIVIGRMPPAIRRLGTHVEFVSAAFAPRHILGLRTDQAGAAMELRIRAFDEEAGVTARVPLPAPGSRFCAAFSVDDRAVALSVNGGAVGSVTSTHPVFDGYTDMFVCGTWGGVHQAEAPVERVIVFPGPVPNGDLPACSVPSRWDP